MVKKISKPKTAATLTKNKAFTKVPVDALRRFKEIVLELDISEAEVLALLIKGYGVPVGTGPDNKKLTEEISLLHDEIQRITKEKDLLELQITEQKSSLDTLTTVMHDFVKQLGCETSQEAIIKMKSLTDRVNELEAAQGQSNDPDEIEALNNQINELTAEVETLENKITELQESNVTLTGKQFVADINEKNFQLAAMYKSNLVNIKAVTGNNETYPNELINWAIKESLRYKFGKI